MIRSFVRVVWPSCPLAGGGRADGVCGPPISLIPYPQQEGAHVRCAQPPVCHGVPVYRKTGTRYAAVSRCALYKSNQHVYLDLVTVRACLRVCGGVLHDSSTRTPQTRKNARRPSHRPTRRGQTNKLVRRRRRWRLEKLEPSQAEADVATNFARAADRVVLLLGVGRWCASDKDDLCPAHSLGVRYRSRTHVMTPCWDGGKDATLRSKPSLQPLS
jgi:hypothetical protein